MGPVISANAYETPVTLSWIFREERIMSTPLFNKTVKFVSMALAATAATMVVAVLVAVPPYAVMNEFMKTVFMLKTGDYFGARMMFGLIMLTVVGAWFMIYLPILGKLFSAGTWSRLGSFFGFHRGNPVLLEKFGRAFGE